MTRKQRAMHRVIWFILAPGLLALAAFLIWVKPPSIAAGTYQPDTGSQTIEGARP